MQKKLEHFIETPKDCKSEIKFYLENFTGKKNIKYVNSKLELMSEELSQLKKGELVINGFQSVVDELICLVNNTSNSILSLNQRPQSWGKEHSHHLSFKAEDFLDANKIAMRRGVKIRKILVIPKDKLKEVNYDSYLKKLGALNFDVEYIFKEELENIDIYQKITEEFNEKISTIRFDQVNFAIYDTRSMEHTYKCTDDDLMLPLSIRLTWDSDEILEFNNLIKSLQTTKFS